MPLKGCGILNLSSTVTKSVRKRKRLDFFTVLKLSNVCMCSAQWGAGGGGYSDSLRDRDDWMGKKKQNP